MTPSGDEVHKLHDCGVVYYKPYPYIICISTESSDTMKLPNVIGETSRIIFEEISSAYPEKS